MLRDEYRDHRKRQLGIRAASRKKGRLGSEPLIGACHLFKVSGKETFKASDEGSHVVVHYTEKGAEKTATAVKDAGKGTWKTTEGTVTAEGRGGKEVTVKTADGAEKTFELGKDATVDSGKGLCDAGKYTAKAGDKVVLYSTVEPAKKSLASLRNYRNSLLEVL